MKRLAYLLLIAALVVVGISMSAHSATPAGHVAAVPSVPAMEALHDHSSTTSIAASVEHDAAPCADCGDDHSGLLVACAFLALLLVVSFLLPVVAVRLGIDAPRTALAVPVPIRTASPRPPDLAELCVSRQ